MSDKDVRDRLAKEYAERKWVVGQQAVAKDGFRAGWEAAMMVPAVADRDFLETCAQLEQQRLARVADGRDE